MEHTGDDDDDHHHHRRHHHHHHHHHTRTLVASSGKPQGLAVILYNHIYILYIYDHFKGENDDQLLGLEGAPF